MIVGRRSSPWTGLVLAVAIPLLFAVGVGLRLWLWPTAGVSADLDRDVRWIRGIAVDGFGNAYAQDLPFLPLIAWVWGGLAALEPAFRTVTDASDPAIRALVKVPASLADLAIAAAVGWWFRERPWAALGAVAAILLWPVAWYVSAWWGGIEAIGVLPAVLAVLAARARLPSLVAVLATLSLLTTPTALLFAIPFLAWFLASQGVRGTVKAIVIGTVTAVILWVPFVASGGPAGWLHRWLLDPVPAADAVLSLGAWNPWWAVQQLGAGGDAVTDTTAVLGPLAFRDVGYLVAAILALLVFAGVYRRRSAQGLAAGLAAMALIGFVAFTGRGPTEAYAAFVFLLMAIEGRVLLAAWGLFALAVAANLMLVAPLLGITVPPVQAVRLIGAAVITLVTLLAVLWTGRGEHVDRDEIGQPLHSIWPSAR